MHCTCTTHLYISSLLSKSIEELRLLYMIGFYFINNMGSKVCYMEKEELIVNKIQSNMSYTSFATFSIRLRFALPLWYTYNIIKILI